MKFLGFKIWKEKGGVVSKRSSWCISYGSYLHICPTLLGVLWQAFSEYKHERHLVG